MARRINEEGLKLVQQWEGLRKEAYRDVAGVWTIGYGHTASAGPPQVKAGMTISDTEAQAILRRDLAKFEARVERLVKVPLTDNQFAALVSFDFNTGALHKSTLLKKLNAGDYDAVPKELMKWVNAGGKPVKGLVNRRAAECGLWVKGEFVSSNYVEASAPAETASKSNEARGAATAGIGILGSACADAAQHIAPMSDAAPILHWLFVGLTVAGIGFGLYATIKRIRADNG